MRFLPDGRDLAVSVIGLGYVGSCLAAALADTGVRVTGVDTDEDLVAELRRGHCRFSDPGLGELLGRGVQAGRLEFTGDYDAVTAGDVVIVAVGTPTTERGRLVDAQISGCARALAPRLRPGQLVVVKSTVPPGTTRAMLAPLLQSGGLAAGEDFGLAFCPERLSQGAALSELRTLPVIVGGWCEASADAAAEFWLRTLGSHVVRCSTLETAELAKLANNWWVDHNIAMANELARICAAIEVDVTEVIEATNSVPKGDGTVNVLSPGVGVGGSCLTKDPWMLWRAARERGVELHTIATARGVNDAMPGHTADLIAAELAGAGKTLEGSRVAVIGLAFKNNTGDLRETPTLPVVAALAAAGAELRLFDPLTDPGEVERAFGQAPVGSVEEAAAGADCLAVLAWHGAFNDTVDLPALAPRAAPGCVIVDGRAYFSAATVDRLRAAGFGYRGIGR